MRELNLKVESPSIKRSKLQRTFDFNIFILTSIFATISNFEHNPLLTNCEKYLKIPVE